MQCDKCGMDLYFGGKGHECNGESPRVDCFEEASEITEACWKEINIKDATRSRLQAWIEAAAQYQRNAEYYRGLLEQCGNSIGPPAFIADDGTISQDVLCAKIPELVEADYAILRKKKIAKWKQPPSPSDSFTTDVGSVPQVVEIFGIAEKISRTYGPGDFGKEMVIPQIGGQHGDPEKQILPLFTNRAAAEEFLSTYKYNYGMKVAAVELRGDS